MKEHVHLVLVGTSLLRNFALEMPQKLRDKYRDVGILQWHNIPQEMKGKST